MFNDVQQPFKFEKEGEETVFSEPIGNSISQFLPPTNEIEKKDAEAVFFHDPLNEQIFTCKYNVKQEIKHNNKEKTVFMIISDIDEKLPLTKQDKLTFQGLCGAIESEIYVQNDGVIFIPLADIARARNLDFSRKPTENQIQKTKESLDRLIDTKIKIDASYELKALKRYNKQLEKDGIKPLEAKKATIDGRILLGDFVNLEYTNGEEAEFLRLASIPPLFLYLKDFKRRVSNVPVKKLMVSDLSNTELIVTLKTYLAQRIEQMLRSNNLSNKILYDTIYKNLEIDKSEKQQRRRVREHTEIILQAYRKNGYIKNYKIEKKGIKYYGVIVDVEKETSKIKK